MDVPQTFENKEIQLTLTVDETIASLRQHSAEALNGALAEVVRAHASDCEPAWVFHESVRPDKSGVYYFTRHAQTTNLDYTPLASYKADMGVIVMYYNQVGLPAHSYGILTSGRGEIFIMQMSVYALFDWVVARLKAAGKLEDLSKIFETTVRNAQALARS